jgi:hypothetical protein
LVVKVFSEGINEKDAISAMALLRHSEANFMGNVLLGTELQRLYILDEYGHSIISTRIVPVVPAILLGFGKLTEKYVIVVIGREGDLCLYMNNDLDDPSERMKSNTRITSACLSFPDLVLVGADQTVAHYVLSNNSFKLLAQRYKMKMGAQPLKAEFLKFKGQKLTILAFEHEVRLYNERELNYTFVTDYPLYNIIWGSFAREECCLILLYEHAGFEVLILHRQFKSTEKYGSNKELKQEYDSIPIPKKTPHFLIFWNEADADEANLYRHFEKSLKLLNWRTLKEKFAEGKSQTQHHIDINSKVLGLGPCFNVQLEIENLSGELLFNVGVMINADREKVELLRWENSISMLPPFTPTALEIQVRSLSLKNESLTVELISGRNIVSSVVFLPNCEEFGAE